MYKHSIGVRFTIVFTIILCVALTFNLYAQTRDVDLILHLRGVYDSKISLLALSGSKTFKPIKEVRSTKNDETVKLTVSKDYLPGEFVLRFDYKETDASAPYPSEKSIFISEQDLELWVNPKYCNNADSSYFQKSEKENNAFALFSKENGKQKETLGVLQNFLMNYDDTGSKFYKQGIGEYEQWRKAYNQWLLNRIQQDKALFVSTLYRSQYVPETSWQGSGTERIKSLASHYFDGMDFKDTLLIKTSYMNKWMDSYVNLYGQLSTTTAIRDSLFPLAGKTAIEKARQGHPLVYGWMVDYFYRGYETNNIPAGMKMLEPYMNDSNCLTTKRHEISKRLKGIETLVAGSMTPNIIMSGLEGTLFELNKLETQSNYILILFWSAGCSHCMEMINNFYPWQQQPDVRQKIMVVAISLDETETEIKAWEQKIKELKGWKHLREAEGVRSKVASDYSVLATPVMVLLDAKTREIIAVPNTLNELIVAARTTPQY